MKRVLITNDDGIESPSIRMLAEEFGKLWEVIVVAPESEKSCSSHSISLNTHVTLSRICQKEQYMEVVISGTPVDCIKFGIQNYGTFDLVVSGINNGANVGYHLFYSGTVAAAIEGAMFNIPSVALSMEIMNGRPDYPFAVNFSRKVAEKLMKDKLPPGSALNINFPDIEAKNIKGSLITHQGDFRFDDIFEKRGEVYALTGTIPPHIPGKSSDFNALQEGFISITPIHTDLTNHHLYRSLKHFEVDI